MLCAHINPLHDLVCGQCRTAAEQPYIVQQQSLLKETQCDDAVHHLLVLQCAAASSDTEVAERVGKFIASPKIFGALLNMWCCSGLVSPRASAVINTLLIRCLAGSKNSFEYWNKIAKAIDPSSKSVVDKLFEGAVHLVHPTSFTDIACGLRSSSLLSVLAHSDASWMSAIDQHCHRAIQQALDQAASTQHNAATPESLTSPLLDTALTRAALTCLCIQGGSCRPKVFYDGCIAKFNNTMVTVVGRRTEKPRVSKHRDPMCVSIGDMVEALYHGDSNGQRWYKQTVVTNVHPDGTVDLRYHDDDFEQRVAPQFVKINGETLEHIRMREKQQQRPKHLCAAVARVSDLQDMNDLSVKEINLETESFHPVHKWLHLPNATALDRLELTFKLVERVLADSSRVIAGTLRQLPSKVPPAVHAVVALVVQTGAVGNEFQLGPQIEELQQKYLTVRHARHVRLICLRVLYATLERMGAKMRANILLKSALVRSIFGIAATEGDYLAVPSQGEPRTRPNPGHVLVGDFVRSPGDPVHPHTNSSSLIGKVTSISIGQASEKRHCCVHFPGGRQTTYDEKNLEIVDVEGTGLVGALGVADAESYVWQTSIGSNAPSSHENRPKEFDTPVSRLADLDKCSRQILCQIYGQNNVGTGDLNQIALALYEGVGPVAALTSPKGKSTRLPPEKFVGSRVKIFWPGDDWYPGVVDRYDKDTRKHHVLYDDGDTRWYVFTEDRKFAISDSENKLPLRFIGGAWPSSISDQPAIDKRQVVAHFFNTNLDGTKVLKAPLDLTRCVKSVCLWVTCDSSGAWENAHKKNTGKNDAESVAGQKEVVHIFNSCDSSNPRYADVDQGHSVLIPQQSGSKPTSTYEIGSVVGIINDPEVGSGRAVRVAVTDAGHTTMRTCDLADVRMQRQDAPLMNLAMQRQGTQVRFVLTMSTVDVTCEAATPKGSKSARLCVGAKVVRASAKRESPAVEPEVGVIMDIVHPPHIPQGNTAATGLHVKVQFESEASPVMLLASDLDFPESSMPNWRVKPALIEHNGTMHEYYAGLHRVRKVSGEWHEATGVATWEHMAVVIKATTDSTSSTQNSAATHLECTLYRNGCIDGKLRWPVADGIPAKLASLFVLNPVQVDGLALKAVNCNLYAFSLNHETVLADMRLAQKGTTVGEDATENGAVTGFVDHHDGHELVVSQGTSALLQKDGGEEKSRLGDGSDASFKVSSAPANGKNASNYKEWADLWTQETNLPSEQESEPVELTPAEESLYRRSLRLTSQAASEAYPAMDSLISMGFSHDICIVAIHALENTEDTSLLSDWILANQDEQLKRLNHYRTTVVRDGASDSLSQNKAVERIPAHVEESIRSQCSSYIFEARRSMSAAAVEIDHRTLVNTDPFETCTTPCSQIILDALPPSFVAVKGDGDQSQLLMHRLECYYARMCATEILSLPGTMNRGIDVFAQELKDFLRSLPFEHAPLEVATGETSAYARFRENIQALIRAEVRRNNSSDTKRSDTTGETKSGNTSSEAGQGLVLVFQNEAIGHLMLCAAGWKLVDSNGGQDTHNVVDSEARKSRIKSWRRHASRACWLLELLFSEFRPAQVQHFITSKFIKLLILSLRTAASSGTDEQTVLRLVRIYGTTRVLRGIDSVGSEAGDLEPYPSDVTCMRAFESAFESRVAELGAQDANVSAPLRNRSASDIHLCSPFDRALASVLLMNGRQKLRGDRASQLQNTYQILCALNSGRDVPFTLCPDAPGAAVMGGGWTRAVDAELVDSMMKNATVAQTIERLRRLQAKNQSSTSDAADGEMKGNSRNPWRRHSKPWLDESRVSARSLWLQWLNSQILCILPLADFERPDRLVKVISSSMDRMLHRTKRLFMQSHFSKRRRARDRSGHVMHLNRFSSVNLFQQAFTQLQSFGNDWINFRKPWKVVFDGEGGSDAGGPGRESVTVIMESVLSTSYHLFVPTPNDLESSQGGEREILREERWLPTPKAQHRHRDEYELLGKLLGMSMREQWSVPIRLARSVWRQILGHRKTLTDLKEEDYRLWVILNELRSLAPEDVGRMGLDFTVRLSDDRIKPLKHNGASIAVTAENVIEYCTLAERRRLEESSTAIAAIIRGFAAVVPLEIVRNLYTWEQLETEVCGTAVLNVDRLRANTTWPGELGPEIEQNFWTMLQSFDPTQQSNFLRFCWGRARLPTDPDKSFCMKVKPLNPRGANRIDDVLPNAHTCDFTLLMPAYSSYRVMREKFLRAIAEQGFDLDGGAHGIAASAMQASMGDGEDGDTDDDDDNYSSSSDDDMEIRLVNGVGFDLSGILDEEPIVAIGGGGGADDDGNDVGTLGGDPLAGSDDEGGS